MGTSKRLTHPHNDPFGLTVCCVLLALAIALALAGCGKVSHTADEHLERGLRFEHQGDLGAASIEYRNALQKQPESAEGRFRLGMLLLETEDAVAAKDELTRAKERGWDPDEIRLPMMRASILLGQYGRVAEETRLIDSFREADVPEALTQRGRALLGMGHTQEAQTAFAQALDLRSDIVDAHIGLALVELRLGDGRKEARRWIESALEIDSSAAQAWGLLGDLERSEGSLEEAELAYGRAIEHAPLPYNFHLKRALARMARQDSPGIEEDLKALRRLGPRNPSTAYIEGLVLYQQNRYADAQAAFEESLRGAPDSQLALFFLGASHFAQQHWQQAERSLQQFLRVQPQSAEAARMLALVRLREGDLDRAQQLVRPVLERGADDALALNIMGNVRLAQGQHEEGIEYLRRLSLMGNNDPALRATLAGGLWRAGEREEALRELEAAVDEYPAEQGLAVALILSLIGGGEFDPALRAAEELIERMPDSALPHNLKAAALMGKGHVDQARESLLEALRVAPADASASSNLAQLALQGGEVDEARSIYREALSQHPGHPSLSLRLAQIEAALGDLETMRLLLEESLQRHPEELAPRLVLGRYHLGRDEPRRALTLLEPARQAGSDHPELLDLLAQAQLKAGQRELAVSTLRALSERVPATADARYRVGLGFDGAESPSAARLQYRRALEIDPGHHGALRSLAALELREGRNEQALDLARRMQAMPATAAAGYATEGRIHTTAGRYEDATRAYSNAYDLEPSASHAVGLGISHLQSGRPDVAASLLTARLAEHPDELNVRFHLAQALFAQEDYPGAIREYEDLARTQPDNPVILNNLANLYLIEGDARALEFAERAHARQPGNPSITHTLGWVLVQHEDFTRGLALLEQARRALPDHPEVRYHYAVGLARTGRAAEARQVLRELLNDVATFAQRADAEALLQSLE